MGTISQSENYSDARHALRQAYQASNLTLYLGAGVSVASNLPAWDQLVYMMYAFVLNKEDKWLKWNPFINYLQAIAEYLKKHESEPLEITARKIRDIYVRELEKPNDFTKDLRTLLYNGYISELDRATVHGYDSFDAEGLYLTNPTLRGVYELCRGQSSGVKSVVTYNYDALLEILLNDVSLNSHDRRAYQSVFSQEELNPNVLPIFHPHGFLPPDLAVGSNEDEVIFTEEQYHRVSMDPYHWSNLIQLSSMSGTVGLMVGLSLSDRNIRRLLDSLASSPLPVRIYALLQAPDVELPDDEQSRLIHERALEIDERKRKSSKTVQGIHGVKGTSYATQIRGIVEELSNRTKAQQEGVLKNMGIIPIWYESHDEIEPFCRAIKSP